MKQSLNILDKPLEPCCTDPMTGFYRDGLCNTDRYDHGSHTVCAIMTQEFLDYTLTRGNDLSTPNPQFGFPGLKPGDGWCLCAMRWKEAWEADKAPPILTASTHKKALDVVSLDVLLNHALH